MKKRIQYNIFTDRDDERSRQRHEDGRRGPTTAADTKARKAMASSPIDLSSLFFLSLLSFLFPSYSSRISMFCECITKLEGDLLTQLENVGLTPN